MLRSKYPQYEFSKSQLETLFVREDINFNSHLTSRNFLSVILAIKTAVMLFSALLKKFYGFPARSW